MFTNSLCLRLTLYSIFNYTFFTMLRSLYYPIRVRQEGSLQYWSVLLRIVPSWLIFVLTVKESSKFSFCGKYYRSFTICKRLSTIRLMNAVSWRYVLALYIQSFCFYIPHKRLKLGGHSYFHKLFWEYPRIERQGLQCDVVTVRLVIMFTILQHPPHS